MLISLFDNKIQVPVDDAKLNELNKVGHGFTKRTYERYLCEDGLRNASPEQIAEALHRYIDEDIQAGLKLKELI